MQLHTGNQVTVEQRKIYSAYLSREVAVDFYQPEGVFHSEDVSLLLINDGQELGRIQFGSMLQQLLSCGFLRPLLCVGIHAGDRLMEYGTAGMADYAGRGGRADRYQQFLLAELLPFVHACFPMVLFREKGVAGFSLGGLSAIDTVWNHTGVFSLAGVFSGSLWWRSKSLLDNYSDETDRIMHQKIKAKTFKQGVRFYFTTGSLDETADRNNNGIIDSIDDTLDLIKELNQLGYRTGCDIAYTNYEEGRHDIESWGRALPPFLCWGWGKDTKAAV